MLLKLYWEAYNSHTLKNWVFFKSAYNLLYQLVRDNLAIRSNEYWQYKYIRLKLLIIQGQECLYFLSQKNISDNTSIMH